jgi:peptidoglycan/xylan/chitin deacetylase (PgdA/CDA1 family)
MYHSISDNPETGAAYFQTVTRPPVFAEQMAVLAGDGWLGVTLSEGLEWLRSSQHQTGVKPVVVTFDDGFRDFATAAVPALERHAFHATMYLPTAFIDNCSGRLRDREHLTWSEIRELHGRGFEFGSHTATHPQLTGLGWREIETELAVSRDAIEQQLSSPATAFAYPYAFPQGLPKFVERFTGLLAAAGYRTCVTTRIGCAGPGDSPLCLPRLPVNSCDDAPLLRAKLAGAYDWLAPVQTVVKRIRNIGMEAPLAP